MKVDILIKGHEINLQYESIDDLINRLWEYFGDIGKKDIVITIKNED